MSGNVTSTKYDASTNSYRKGLKSSPGGYTKKNSGYLDSNSSYAKRNLTFSTKNSATDNVFTGISNSTTQDLLNSDIVYFVLERTPVTYGTIYTQRVLSDGTNETIINNDIAGTVKINGQARDKNSISLNGNSDVALEVGRYPGYKLTDVQVIYTYELPENSVEPIPLTMALPTGTTRTQSYSLTNSCPVSSLAINNALRTNSTSNLFEKYLAGMAIKGFLTNEKTFKDNFKNFKIVATFSLDSYELSATGMKSVKRMEGSRSEELLTTVMEGNLTNYPVLYFDKIQVTARDAGANEKYIGI